MGEQLPDRGLGSADLVGDHRRQLGPVGGGVQEDGRDSLQRRWQMHPPVEHGRVEEPVHLVLQEGVGRLLLHRRVAVGADQDQRAPVLQRRVLGADHDAAGEGCGRDRVADQPEHPGPSRAHPAGQPVGDVAELSGGTVDSLPGLDADPGAGHVVEHLGDGRCGDPRQTCDVLDARRLPGPPGLVVRLRSTHVTRPRVRARATGAAVAPRRAGARRAARAGAAGTSRRRWSSRCPGRWRARARWRTAATSRT